jgi:hypothetical protein
MNDFGVWTARPGEEATCLRHGRLAGGFVVSAEGRAGQVLVRRYCPLCVVEVLDGNVAGLRFEEVEVAAEELD